MRLFQAILIATALSVVVVGDNALAASKAEQSQEVRNMADETLARLYKVQPRAHTAVAKAAGYAVFSNFGMEVLLAGGASCATRILQQHGYRGRSIAGGLLSLAMLAPR